jgi:hypothetical protein
MATDRTYNVGTGEYAGGVRPTPPFDADWMARSNLMTCLQNFAVMEFRAWLQRNVPAAAAQVDRAIKDALGDVYADPKASVNAYSRDRAAADFQPASPYARGGTGVADSSAAYGTGPDGQPVRLSPALANRR